MQRIVSAILLLIIMTLFTGCKKETSLLSNIDQYRTNKIVSTLQKHGISCSKVANKKGTAYSIIIDADDLAKATAILSTIGPFTPAHPPQNPCEFKGLIATPSEERSCKKYRLESSLEDTLIQIDGIISTEVHIVMSEATENSVRTDFLSSSAAIFIKHQNGVDLSPFKSNIKRLVEKSIPGLTYDKVSLVFIPASPLDSSLENLNEEDNNSLNSPLIISLIAVIIILILTLLAFVFKEKLSKFKPKQVKPEKEPSVE